MNNQLRDRNNTSSFFKDASVFVLILTGLTYFLGFNYKKGFLDYYGIDRLMLDNIGMYYINNSFKNIILFIVVIGGIYMARPLIALPFKRQGEESYRETQLWIIIILLLICFMTFWLGVIATFNTIAGKTITTGILIISCILCIIFWKRIEMKYKEIFKVLKILRSNIKKSKHLKFIACIIILSILSWIFWVVGQADAETKTSYLVIESKSKPLVIIDQDGDKLLVAPLDIKKGLIYQKYMVIESKSTLEKPLKFEKFDFTGGLEIKKIKQLETSNHISWLSEGFRSMGRAFQYLIP